MTKEECQKTPRLWEIRTEYDHSTSSICFTKAYLEVFIKIEKHLEKLIELHEKGKTE